MHGVANEFFQFNNKQLLLGAYFLYSQGLYYWNKQLVISYFSLLSIRFGYHRVFNIDRRLMPPWKTKG